jgi:cytochrome c oxidase cbb3-type subunit 2
MQPSFYEKPSQLFGVVFLGFLALSYLIAIGPALSAQSSSSAGPAASPYSGQELRGLAVYVREGCPYCHTQQVRPLALDAAWGRPTLPSDYARLEPLAWYAGTPGLLGSQRTGPDLSNVGDRQASDDWQLIHLYSPRAVVPSSVMPALPWLFRLEARPKLTDRTIALPAGLAPEGMTVVASEAAVDLVAYLRTLKQGPGSSSGRSSARTVNREPGDGAELFQLNCASCHQATGQGLPNVFPALAGNEAVNAQDPTVHVASILHGVQGKTIAGFAYSAAMPACASLLDDAQVRAIVNHERTSWGNSAPLVSIEQVKTIRESGRRP